MPDPQYRRRLQVLTDLLLMTLPSGWQDVTLRAAFPSDVRTRLEVAFRVASQSAQTPADIPTALTRDFAHAARALRTELVSAGNPECKGFVFWLSKAGKSALDVEY